MDKWNCRLKWAFSRVSYNIVFAGVLLLTLTLGLGAWATYPQLTPEGAKGLYSAGNAVYFWTDRHETVYVAVGPWYVDMWLQKHGHSWDASTAGGLGGCIFDSAAYCFFTTTSGDLKYVKINPSNGDVLQSPSTIATGIKAAGVAAAVQNGWIYVFTATKTFHSHDGKNYASAYPAPNGADAIIDAVTYYPPDNAVTLPDSSIQHATMVIYREGNTLKAERFQVPHFGFSGDPMTLPNPLSYPVARGNLILGTSQGYPSAGAKDPCIQFYGCSDWEISATTGYTNYEYGRWEYNIKTGRWNAWRTKQGLSYHAPPGIAAAPWFETIDTTSGTMHMYHMIFDLETYVNTLNPSDYEVPMYNDPDYGWAGKPTPTASASEGSNLRNLWTLVGVILGPPPYPMNGATTACPSPSAPLGWVDYGKDTSTSVSTTSTSSSTISVASETKIQGGLGSASLDLSYAHAWTSSHGTSHTVSVSHDFQFDPCFESGEPGIHGWAIFNAPTLVTQRYKLYAYDYNYSHGSGTYLGQSIYATATGAVVQQTAYFELQDPSQGEYTGLFEGMPLYPDSTDVVAWNQSVPDWDSGGSNWTVVFGDATNPQMPVLNMGEKDEVSYTESDTKVDSKGNSNSFGVKAGAKLGILGFSEEVTAGYNGKWTTTTENESTITQNVACGLNVPIPPETPGYVKSLTVQPYWLTAKTNKAPWIPTGYSGNLPWCITWDVTSYSTNGGSTSGVSAPPTSVIGTIRHGKKKKKDTYKLDGGRMAWLEADGSETPIPMSADNFDKSKGAFVSLNGHVFAADGSKGKWTRKGDTWKYKTQDGVKNDPFVLKLDFAAAEWSLDASSKTLDNEIKAAGGLVRVVLNVEGSYLFKEWLKHDVDVTWNHHEDASTWQDYGVHRVKGAYNSATGVGNLMLKGHLPKNEKQFGDMEVVVNGASVDIPILATSDFLGKLDRGGRVTYEAEGLSFEIDFGDGRWKLRLEGDNFQAAMAPDDGTERVQVLVGGDSLSDQTFVIKHHQTNLTYGG